MFYFFTWVLVIRGDQFVNIYQVYDMCTFLQVAYTSIQCFKKYSSPSDGFLEKNLSLGLACF